MTVWRPVRETAPSPCDAAKLPARLKAKRRPADIPAAGVSPSAVLLGPELRLGMKRGKIREKSKEKDTLLSRTSGNTREGRWSDPQDTDAATKQRARGSPMEWGRHLYCVVGQRLISRTCVESRKTSDSKIVAPTQQ